MNFAGTRSIETAFESIPQVILQALALADLRATKSSKGQYLSIAWSIVNIAYMSTGTSALGGASSNAAHEADDEVNILAAKIATADNLPFAPGEWQAEA